MTVRRAPRHGAPRKGVPLAVDGLGDGDEVMRVFGV
jgi:hypothetical protein